MNIETQAMVSSGYIKKLKPHETKISPIKKIMRISRDDVTIQEIQAEMEFHRSEIQLMSVGKISGDMASAETAMTEISEILQQSQTVIQKDNGEGEKIADELKSLQGKFLNSANSKLDEKYTFGGFTEDKRIKPFTVGSNGRINYSGVEADKIKEDYFGGLYYERVDSNGKFITDSVTGNPIKVELYDKEGEDADLGNKLLIPHSGLSVMGFGTDEQGQSNNLYNILTDLESNFRGEPKGTETLSHNPNGIRGLTAQLDKGVRRFENRLTDIKSDSTVLKNLQTKLETTVENRNAYGAGSKGLNNRQKALIELKSTDNVLKAAINSGGTLPPTLENFLRG